MTADDGVLLSSCEWRNGDIVPWANEAFCQGRRHRRLGVILDDPP